MIGSWKRLFSKGPQERDFGELADWAKRRNLGFRRVRGDEGFVIDGLLEGRPWRMEWGPPHRDYIHGHELRLRMELDLASDAQMLVLSRPLMDALERKTFEEFTDSVQTQIGTKTPEEMRWLVMFPKLDFSAYKTLRARFGAVASQPTVGMAWIEGPLANMLEHAALDLLRDDPPFVLMTLRGRAYLRLQLTDPDPKSLGGALALFETGVAQALRVTGESIDPGAESRSGDKSTLWQSFPPEGRPKRK